MSKCQNFYCNTCFPWGGLSYGPQCSPGAMPEIRVGQIWADDYSSKCEITRVSSDTVFYITESKYDGRALLSYWLEAAKNGRFRLVSSPAPQTPKVCDCGGAKARTTHSSWCSTTAK